MGVDDISLLLVQSKQLLGGIVHVVLVLAVVDDALAIDDGGVPFPTRHVVVGKGLVLQYGKVGIQLLLDQGAAALCLLDLSQSRVVHQQAYIGLLVRRLVLGSVGDMKRFVILLDGFLRVACGLVGCSHVHVVHNVFRAEFLGDSQLLLRHRQSLLVVLHPILQKIQVGVGVAEHDGVAVRVSYGEVG